MALVVILTPFPQRSAGLGDNTLTSQLRAELVATVNCPSTVMPIVVYRRGLHPPRMRSCRRRGER